MSVAPPCPSDASRPSRPQACVSSLAALIVGKERPGNLLTPRPEQRLPFPKMEGKIPPMDLKPMPTSGHLTDPVPTVINGKSLEYYRRLGIVEDIRAIGIPPVRLPRLCLASLAWTITVPVRDS